MIKKFFCTLIFAASIFNFSATSAENLKFIDATGDTGYYVDLDSVKKESNSIFFVDFIVIRADKNEMTIANLQINHSKKNYLVRTSKTLSYDERTEIHSDDTKRIVKSYSDKSLMNEIVQIILSEGNI